MMLSKGDIKSRPATRERLDNWPSYRDARDLASGVNCHTEGRAT